MSTYPKRIEHRQPASEVHSTATFKFLGCFMPYFKCCIPVTTVLFFTVLCKCLCFLKPTRCNISEVTRHVHCLMVSQYLCKKRAYVSKCIKVHPIKQLTNFINLIAKTKLLLYWSYPLTQRDFRHEFVPYDFPMVVLHTESIVSFHFWYKLRGSVWI